MNVEEKARGLSEGWLHDVDAVTRAGFEAEVEQALREAKRDGVEAAASAAYVFVDGHEDYEPGDVMSAALEADQERESS